MFEFKVLMNNIGKLHMHGLTVSFSEEERSKSEGHESHGESDEHGVSAV